MVRPPVPLTGSPDRATGWRRWAGLVGGLAACAAALWCGNRLPSGSPGWLIPGVIGLGWLGFGLAVLSLRRIDDRLAPGLVLVGAVGLVLAAGFGPPRSSDDLYRYVWDGRVQAAGIDPYRYVPAAPELLQIRDPQLWPASSRWCVGPADAPLVPGCTLINRPTVHTIYPPAAQLFFLTVHSAPGYLGPRLLGAGFALATTILLLAGLRRLGADPRRAALWAWCPAVALEAVANAHIDAAAAFLTVAALLALVIWPERRATLVGGALLGLAVGVKLTPAVVLPAALRRRGAGWLLLALSTVVSGLYLPHVLAVGGSALGYLAGYAQEEGYANGTRFALIPLSGAAAIAVAVAALAAAAIWAWKTTRPDRPWEAAATTTGALLLITAPANPWYSLLLVALVGLGARTEWLLVAAAGYLPQWAPQLHLGGIGAARLGYGLAGALILAAWLRRRSGSAWRSGARVHARMPVASKRTTSVPR